MMNIFLPETCEDDMLFYSTPSDIISYYPACNISVSDSILGYDKHNRKLLYYDSVKKNLYSAALNCSDLRVLSNMNFVRDYAYDGVNGILYYVHSATLHIQSFLMSSGVTAAVEVMRSLSGIKGMEMDTKNG